MRIFLGALTLAHHQRPIERTYSAEALVTPSASPLAASEYQLRRQASLYLYISIQEHIRVTVYSTHTMMSTSKMNTHLAVSGHLRKAPWRQLTRTVRWYRQAVKDT